MLPAAWYIPLVEAPTWWRVEGASFIVQVESSTRGLFVQGLAKEPDETEEHLLSGGGQLLTDAEVQGLREFLDRHGAVHRSP